MSNRPPILILQENDSVAIAMRDLTPGEPAGIGGLATAGAIPRGHKLALRDIALGEAVRKYGQIIGAATDSIVAGAHVHSHNLAFRPSTADHAIGTAWRPVDVLPMAERATFNGILRSDGQAATRNYIGVMTTVNCANTAARLYYPSKAMRLPK